MFQRELTKPDGRRMTLYSRRPISPDLTAPSPSDEPVEANPHLRWHPLRGEWVTYAAHRQNRTFLPPPEYNPLAPTHDPDHPTELPTGDYDVAVFDNRFPSLAPTAHDAPPEIVPTRPGNGACEVVVFTQDPTTSLGRLPVDQIALIVDCWADRTKALGERDEIVYVMPFENRGVEVGVTLLHPHGQIYAYPVVPPVPARELSMQAEHWAEHGRGLLADLIAAELKDGRRIIYDGPHAVAFVPVCARYTYEVWVLPKRPAPLLSDLTDDERTDLARALKSTLLRYDGLWDKPMPYLMCIHQAPTDGQPHPEAHVHFEFYPALRTPQKLKYLAGTEIGAGFFANDALPEAKAAELRAVKLDEFAP